VALHCYVVTYDISCPKRWREVYRLMNGYGEWVQLSVFRCDLTPVRLAELKARVGEAIHHDEDQVLIVEVGPSASTVPDAFDVLGRHREFALPSAKVV